MCYYPRQGGNILHLLALRLLTTVLVARREPVPSSWNPKAAGSSPRGQATTRRRYAQGRQTSQATEENGAKGGCC